MESMIIYIHHLVHDEQRPFSYLDFIGFEVEGHEYHMTHGTFRNYVSRLMKEGLIEVSYRSSITFYTLRGVKFDKTSRIAMTSDHTGVASSSVLVSSRASLGAPSPLFLSSNPLYRVIKDLPLDRTAVHDIRLRFSSPKIYAITSSSITDRAQDHDYKYTINSRSLDIILPAWKIKGLLVKLTIHRTDTVSIAIGCSLNPVPLDVNGIIRLTNALSVVEDRLSRLVERSNAVVTCDGSGSNNSPKDQHTQVGIIPKYPEWIVTMWHFGADASVEYSGDKFCVTWETAENVLIRAYSKLMADNRTRIRLERQEYPGTTLADAIEQKINGNHRSGGGGGG